MPTSFRQFLAEELSDKQKDKVDSWGLSHVAKAISKHVMPPGQSRMTIPLDDPNDIVNPEVREHLNKGGYQISDYVGGKAKDKYGRETKIGKALNSVKAPQHVIDGFNSDPKRDPSRHQTKLHDNLQVVISHHPYDVAGMSTDRPWTSCVDMATGSNKHYLEHEVRQGTHVAYLTQKGDDTVKNPIARIALKPYREEKSDRTVLLPENKIYGEADNAFEHTVNKFVNNHFPLKPDTFYTKNSKVYDDSRTTHTVTAHLPSMSDEKIKSLNTLSPNVPENESKRRKAIFVARYGSNHQKSITMHHPSPIVREVTAIHGNEEHHKHLENDPDKNVRAAVMKARGQKNVFFETLD